MQTDTDVFLYAKSFFGFGDDTQGITIVVPHVEQTRALSLRCRNYPPFDYEISPDDAFSAFRILGLLSAIYGERSRISIASDAEYHDHPTTDTVFVGGPPTNAYIHHLTRKGPLKFGENNEQRSIQGSKDIYWIKFREHFKNRPSQRIFNSLSIEEDYCLIAKNTVRSHVQFAVGGLRAYGQRAAYDFLNDSDFYGEVETLFEYPFFRILVRVGVNDHHITDAWEIVETEKSEDGWKTDNGRLIIFLSYVNDDWEARVKFLAKRLEQERFDVRVANRRIQPACNWKEAIEREIKCSDVVVICFSQNYVNRDKTFLDDELSIALRLDKFVVPVRFDPCPIHHPSLRDHQWSDLFDGWDKKTFDWMMEDWTREKNLRGLIKMLYKKHLEKNSHE